MNYEIKFIIQWNFKEKIRNESQVKTMGQRPKFNECRTYGSLVNWNWKAEKLIAYRG